VPCLAYGGKGLDDDTVLKVAGKMLEGLAGWKRNDATVA
jgi:hypothetical protein